MMQGFKDESYNIDFEDGLFESIMEHLIRCSDEMKADCIETGNLLNNNEDKITNRLVENYLNKGSAFMRFILQSPESFVPDEDIYKGRTDIKVVPQNWFMDINDYYIIECKRIDGKAKLNKEYIINGIARFVISPPKYSSFNKRNIMFGYVVQDINIPNNTIEIERLQKTMIDEVTSEGFILNNNSGAECYIYSCKYTVNTEWIELRHLFYDFSDCISS
ncbi:MULTISPECIES: hypothetical protein [unclassified Clostridium]|uniref:hypothetical protein n=1 Tax=unclassified Clostridium TaxID=2614128 RepID=UPI001105B002|nr:MULTISPECIES: hypothetical protein [unclassified Clostridium]